MGDGDVYLNDLIVEGDTVIRGGGKDSIHINGGQYTIIRIERMADGGTRVVAVGVKDADGNPVDVVIAESATGGLLILEGDFDEVTIEGSGITLETQGETVIREVMVGETATEVLINTSSDTKIGKVVTNNDSTKVEGAGTVGAIEGNVSLGNGVSTTPPLPSTGGSGGGGGGGGRKNAGHQQAGCFAGLELGLRSAYVPFARQGYAWGKPPGQGFVVLKGRLVGFRRALGWMMSWPGHWGHVCRGVAIACHCVAEVPGTLAISLSPSPMASNHVFIPMCCQAALAGQDPRAAWHILATFVITSVC